VKVHVKFKVVKSTVRGWGPDEQTVTIAPSFQQTSGDTKYVYWGQAILYCADKEAGRSSCRRKYAEAYHPSRPKVAKSDERGKEET